MNPAAPSIGLISTIDSNAPENMVNSKVLSDTRSIFYKYKDFKDFINNERIYQNTNRSTNRLGVKIEAIEVYFASYSNLGIGENERDIPTGDYKNRLFMNFEFIRNGQIFYIDSAGDFGSRPRTPMQEHNKGGDHGDLCPKICPH
ncbi:MAG: hypothetical protein WDO19_31060 [Bacteroidota bacterium]